MRKFPPSLEAWRDPIEKTINKTLKANFDKREANQIIKYMFRTGGKRCRPLLVVLSAEALGGKPEEALEAAAAVEIIHAATLVFDDMIDKDQVRRGAPTIHMAFSNEKALTSGLFLASKGVQLLSNYKNPEVMRMIGTTLVDISKGELLDILGDFNASVSECIAIADLKTASLFGTAAGIGAAIAGVDGRDSCSYSGCRSEERGRLQIRNSDTLTHTRVEVSENIKKFSFANIYQRCSNHSHDLGILVVGQELNALRSKKQTRR